MALPIRFADNTTRDLAHATHREWLETNGLGGWSSSTLCMAHTRRYHGLLVVAQHPPVGRVVLLSHLDERLSIGEDRLELGCHLFPGATHPQGHTHISSFALTPSPTFTYSNRDLSLRKQIIMLYGEHSLVIRYELMRAASPVHMELQPFFAGRDYHHLMQANDGVQREAQFGEDILSYAPYSDLPTTYIHAPNARYAAAPDWYYNFIYPREEERGLDASEDLFTPGQLSVTLAVGQPLHVLVSTEDPSGRNPERLLADELTRREQVVLPAAVAQEPVLSQLSGSSGSVPRATRQRPPHNSGWLSLVHGLGTRYYDRAAWHLPGLGSIFRGAPYFSRLHGAR